MRWSSLHDKNNTPTALFPTKGLQSDSTQRTLKMVEEKAKEERREQTEQNASIAINIHD